MIRCSDDCIPCCDYCKYARYEWQEICGKVVVGCQCSEERQRVAVNLGYCEDFHCLNAKE